MAHGGDIYSHKVNTDHSVNLNPLGAPESLLDSVDRGIGHAGEYPDIRQDEVRMELALTDAVAKENVIAGNGASELIMAALRAVNPRNVLLCEPGFSGYRHATDSMGSITVQTYMLKKENGFLLTEDFVDAISEDTGMIFLADPNNPTGLNIDRELLIKILDKAKHCGVYVLLDRSFLLMSDNWRYAKDASGLINKYDNLIAVMSLTKLFALPGIRMGYAVAESKLIKRIFAQLPEWNLSVISSEVIKAGSRLIRETDFCERTVSCIEAERIILANALKEFGLKVYPCNTSFIMFEARVDLYEKLLERGILIRDLSDIPGLKKGYYRIAVKDHDANARLIEEIKGII